MWLLNTRTLELREFTNPKKVRYVILSHVWQDADKTYSFQSIRDLCEKCRDSGEDPLTLAPEKVRQFCRLAVEDGYEWAWLDTCCIDKSSSAELSEAINSMYAWYRAAHVCYAYLFDIPDDDNPFSSSSLFRKSKWHTRGWTLQELVAPKHVVFLSASWGLVGTRRSLVKPLTECTGIDSGVLLHPIHKEKMSVAHRMSWAARRVTTRPEDRAYSLMGLFGVNMPVIYGEGGEKAFLRLQKEVIAVCPDQSIFAWGPIHCDFDVALDAADSPLSPIRLTLSESRNSGLLATSPADFSYSSGIRLLDPSRYTQVFGRAVDYKCTFSANGITLRLPMSSDFLSTFGDMVLQAAALACTTTANEDTVIFLFLARSASGPPANEDDPPQELAFTRVGQRTASPRSSNAPAYSRGAILPLTSIGLGWLHRKPIYHQELRIEAITHHDTSNATMPGLLQPLPLEFQKIVLEIPYWVFRRLEYHGFTPSVYHSTRCIEYKDYRFTFKTTGDAWRTSSSPGGPTLTILFMNAKRMETLVVVFGVLCRCKAFVRSPQDLWIDVFFVRGILDPADTVRALGLSLARSYVTPDRRPGLVRANRERLGGPSAGCGLGSNIHLMDVEERKQPAVFLIGTAAREDYALRLESTSYTDSPGGRHFVVTLDLEGSKWCSTDPTPHPNRPALKVYSIDIPYLYSNFHFDPSSLPWLAPQSLVEQPSGPVSESLPSPRNLRARLREHFTPLDRLGRIINEMRHK